MGSMRRRLRKLEEAAAADTTTLVCPECGEEFTPTGDPAVEYLCWEWAQGYKGKTYRETPADVLRIAEHEHDPSLMIDRATGESWMGEFFAGNLRTLHDAEDLSEL